MPFSARPRGWAPLHWIMEIIVGMPVDTGAYSGSHGVWHAALAGCWHVVQCVLMTTIAS